MKIRKATVKDVQQLVSLNDEVQSIHLSLFPDVFVKSEKDKVEKWLTQTLGNEPTIILVAEHGDSIAGYMTLQKQVIPAHAFKKERKCGYIDQVCVTESYRGNGIFKAFMNKVKKIVKQWDLDRIELDVWTDNTEAKKAFYNCGFRTYNEKIKMEL
jgi:ribosomal protein S18 acetylase RimI-like enzyme